MKPNRLNYTIRSAHAEELTLLVQIERLLRQLLLFYFSIFASFFG